MSKRGHGNVRLQACRAPCAMTLFFMQKIGKATPMFANRDLEEWMLFGRNPAEAMASSEFGHGGTAAKPLNATDTMIASVNQDDMAEDSEARAIREAFLRRQNARSSA